MKKTPANRNGTGKPRPTAFKPGQSGNPAGAPKRGQSWREIWDQVGNMTPAEAVTFCKSIAEQLGKIHEPITLKQAVVLRAFVAMLFEPDARLLNAAMDRTDGKVIQTTADLTALVAAELARRGMTPAQAVAADPLMRDLFSAVGLPVEVGG